MRKFITEGECRPISEVSAVQCLVSLEAFFCRKQTKDME